MRTLASVIFFALAIGTALAEDAAPLRGVWQSISVEVEGERRDVTLADSAAYTFDGMSLTIKSREMEVKMSFTFDATKSPMHIDLIPLAGSKELTVPGLFEIRDGVLAICMETRKNPMRPTEFTAKEGSRQTIFRFRRATPK